MSKAVSANFVNGLQDGFMLKEMKAI